jgi:hypothetical protein
MSTSTNHVRPGGGQLLDGPREMPAASTGLTFADGGRGAGLRLPAGSGRNSPGDLAQRFLGRSLRDRSLDTDGHGLQTRFGRWNPNHGGVNRNDSTGSHDIVSQIMKAIQDHKLTPSDIRKILQSLGNGAEDSHDPSSADGSGAAGSPGPSSGGAGSPGPSSGGAGSPGPSSGGAGSPGPSSGADGSQSAGSQDTGSTNGDSSDAAGAQGQGSQGTKPNLANLMQQLIPYLVQAALKDGKLDSNEVGMLTQLLQLANQNGQSGSQAA